MTDSAPKRIQRKRTKGWKMPEGAVYVGRNTVWGNSWKVGLVTSCKCRQDDDFPCVHNAFRRASAIECVAAYREWMTSSSYRMGRIAELRGKDLACWCPLVDKDGNPVPCHADVLLEIANA